LSVQMLILVKRAVNHAARVLGKLVPRVVPARPVSSLTKDLFDLLREAVAMHPDRFYRDQNFPRILDAAERTLVYVAELDGHYAGQLAQAFLLIHDLVAESRRRFPPDSRGDVAWLMWASRHGIAKVKEAER